MRIDVTDLLGRPGATRRVDRSLARDEIGEPAPAWGPADEALRGDLHLDVHLEMLVDGLLVRGELRFRTNEPCARCVTDVIGDHEVAVSEMYVDPARVEEDEDEELESGYELHVAEAYIDIEALVRDAILAVLWGRTLCTPECAGLCPRCGADRNVADCGHEREQPADPRWAVLESLDVPPG
jgi:uncharacterized protein